ncbi:MAG: MFS transporter [Chloroflexi bacterium]|nr:MFS transporter [Chloroflexota bacterium]MBP8057756.1 MFS transporter [Chloroflexota bacterium]
MSTNKEKERQPAPGYFFQRRVSAVVDHLRPHRWNWYTLVRPLDRTLAQQTAEPLPHEKIRSLRYFWIDGLFAAVSENFHLSFVALFALAYGASNGQVGWLTALGNLLGALALFPGARLVETKGQRKPMVVWYTGVGGRLTLLFLALFPFFIKEPVWGIVLIILLNGIRAFLFNFSNPAWTSLVADIVPDFMRGRYFGSRNTAMGIAALLVAPLAGVMIRELNGLEEQPYLGYQAVFFCAFVFGVISTLSFNRIQEPPLNQRQNPPHQRGDTRRLLKQNIPFLGMVISAFVWGMSLQVAAPFFNVYLVREFNAGTGLIGAVTAVSSFMALWGQWFFGRMMDKKGAMWVQKVCGLMIPILPFAWMFITAPWQVGLINTLGGFIWAGYNLSNFSLLLEMTPEQSRPRAVALYQTTVFTSAVLGPLVGGYLADAVSFQLIFGLSAGGRMLGMVIFLLFIRGLRPKDGPPSGDGMLEDE